MVSSESAAAATAAVLLAVALTLLAGAATGGATPAPSEAGVDDATLQHGLDCDDDGPPPWAEDDDDDDDGDDDDGDDEEDEEDDEEDGEEDDEDCENEGTTTATTTTATAERTTAEPTDSETTRDSETRAPETTVTTAETPTGAESAGEARTPTTAVATEGSPGSGAAAASTTGPGSTATEVPGERSTTTSSGTALFSVSDAALSVSQVSRGTDVFVSAEVRNRGDSAGEFDAELVVDGTVRATHTVSLAPGERTTVRFRLALAEPGEHAVAVNDADAGSLSVVVDDRASDAAPGPLEISSVSMRDDWVKDGHETVVSAVVRNPTGEPVNRTLRVTVDGAVVARHTVWLAPGEETRITVPFEAVEGTVAVDGVAAGELSVSESIDAVDATAQVSDEDGGDGGLGVALALLGTMGLALLAGVTVATRRDT